MSQSASKTEKPTPKKIRDAREKGQVIKSNEIISGSQILAIVVYFWVFGVELVQSIISLIDESIALVNQPFHLAIQNMFLASIDVAQHFMGILALFLMLTTILAAVGQFGFLFSPESIKPSLEKISILKNLKNIFSMNSLFELIKSILKITLLSCSFYIIFIYYLDDINILPACGTLCALIVSGNFLIWLMAILIIFYFIFSIIDYLFQYHITTKKLMMSRQEIMDEYKNTEGNPEIKRERRRMQNEVQSGSLAKNVSNATVLIKNPTHISICLYYKIQETPLPIIVEKGTDTKAQLMLKIADATGVPIVENIHVARQLLDETNVGDFIPDTLFASVALILKTILEETQQDNT